MYQIIVLEDGEPRHKIACHSFVIGAVNQDAGSCITKREGALAFCSFAAMALFAEASDTLKDHLLRPAEPAPD